MTQTTTGLRFLGDWGVWFPVTLALLLAGGAWALYWREVRRRTGSERWVLPTLRALAVFLLVLILTGPVLHHRRTIGELARVLVFVDASKSMGVTDDAMDASRKLLVAHAYGWFDADLLKTNWLGIATGAEKLSNAVTAAGEKFDGVQRWKRVEQLLLDEKDGVLPKLVKKHNVELWAITDTERQRWWSGEQGLALPKSFQTKPEGNSTDLSAPIAARVGQQHDERSAVVLVSDGQHNRGGSPLEVAKIAGARNVPVFTVGIGALERPKDLAVMDVTAPESVFFEDRVKGEVVLKDDMPPGQAFTLKIEEDGETLWEKALVTDRTHRRKVEFDFPIKELIEGKRHKTEGVEYTSFPLTMKVSLTPLTGEKDTTNNISVFRTRAVTQKRKLLLLDGRPRWEFRYLRNTFERDPQWEVNALVAGTELNDNWEHGDKPGQLPATKEALFAYDLIGFGEVPAKLLKKEDLEWIKEFVGTRGGGLFFVDGQRDLLRGYSEFKSLFPVEWLDKAPKELPTVLQLTDSGASFGPLRLAGDAGENAALWKQLKPPHWVAPTRALPGSETLVETDRKLPAVVMRQFGAGKVLYMGIDDTWRWRFDVANKYQDAFWHQMANAIMEAAYAAQNKHIALDAGAVNYQAGDTAEIRVRLRDDQGRLITAGHPIAVLSRDGKKIASIPLAMDENSAGAFRGKTPVLMPGRYEVRVDDGHLVPETADMPVEFYVQRKGGDASREMVELTCNEELLQQMARASGGEYYREEDAAKLINSLDPLSKGRIEESETILWQSWYWFVPVIALLTTEWILRKRTGLI
jgi:von Willebrand factor type A domain